MSRFKSFLLNLGLLFISLLMVMGALEIALRLTVYHFNNYPVSPGPGSVYEINSPEFRTKVRINSLNVRGPEIPTKKDGEYRILCFGDSFTFGLGVEEEDAYPSVLGRLLRKEKDFFTAYDASPGRNAKDTRDFLYKQGNILKPDLAVIQIYLGNDFYDCLIYEPKKNKAINPPSYNIYNEVVQPIKSFFKDNCVALDFLWNRAVQISFVDRWLYHANLRYGNRAQFLKKYPVLEHRLVRYELGYLKDVDRYLTQNGVNGLYLIVPSKEQLNLKKLMRADQYDYRKPNKIIRAYLRHLNRPFIDLTDSYEIMDPATVKTLYFQSDMHWTRRGCMFTAQKLSEYILAHYLDEHPWKLLSEK